MRTAKTLIRLGGCPGWSESSLGAHAILLVLSWGGSNSSMTIIILNTCTDRSGQTLTVFFYLFGFYGMSRLFHSFWANDPWEKPPDPAEAELDLSHMWPKTGSNPHHRDDKQFRVVKISVFNHSAMGAARSDCAWRSNLIRVFAMSA